MPGASPMLLYDASGAPVYTDGVHIRPAYSIEAAAYLAPALGPPSRGRRPC